MCVGGGGIAPNRKLQKIVLMPKMNLKYIFFTYSLCLEKKSTNWVQTGLCSRKMILKSTFCTLRVPYCCNAEFCWSESRMVVKIYLKRNTPWEENMWNWNLKLERLLVRFVKNNGEKSCDTATLRDKCVELVKIGEVFYWTTSSYIWLIVLGGGKGGGYKKFAAGSAATLLEKLTDDAIAYSSMWRNCRTFPLFDSTLHHIELCNSVFGHMDRNFHPNFFNSV